MKRLAIFFLAALLGGTSAPASAQELRVKDGVSANMRERPGTKNKVIRKLQSGTIVNQLGKTIDDSGWVRVLLWKDKKETYGWVQEDQLEWTNPIDWSFRAPTVSISDSLTVEKIARFAVNEAKTLGASISGSGALIHVWDMQSGQLVKAIETSRQYISEISFVRDDIVTIGSTFAGSLINLNDSREIHYDSNRGIYGPLYKLNDINENIYYNVHLGTPLYYDIRDLSSFFDASLYGAKFGKKINADVKIFDVLPKRGSGPVSILTVATGKNDGNRSAVLFGMNNEVISRSALFSNTKEVVGYNRSQNILFLVGSEYNLSYLDWVTGKDIDIASPAYFVKVDREGNLAYIHEKRLFYRKYDSDIVSPIDTSPYEASDILYIDAGLVILQTYDGKAIKIDVESGKTTRFGSDEERFKATYVWPMPEPDQFLAVDGTEGRVIRLDYAAVEKDVLLLGANKSKGPSIAYRTYVNGPLVSNADRSKYLSRKNGKVFVVDARRGTKFEIDNKKIEEIVQSHNETDVNANDADIESDLSNIEFVNRRGLGAAFIGEKIVFAASTNPWVSARVTGNKFMALLNAAAENEGKSVRVPVQDMSTARGITTAFYMFDSSDGSFVRSHEAETDVWSCASSIPISDDRIGCVSADDVAVVDINTGKTARWFRTPLSDSIERIAYDARSERLFAISPTGEMAILSLRSGEKLARVIISDTGWIIQTPAGFYASGGDGDSHLNASYGVEGTYPIDKFRDSMYRPDLVAEVLRGDPEGLVKQALTQISLEKILASGAAPSITIKGEQEGGIVRASGEIKESGGGIGRTEWRVNGVAQASDEGKTKSVAELFLADGDNRIELIGYNKANTIQGRSEPVTFKMEKGQVAPPRLFVLAVGVDKYRLDALQLKYAAGDATHVAEAFEKAGAGLYAEIFTEVLTNDQVTRETIDAKFRELAKSVRPNDVFVFFSAGHGKTIDGRFFFIPQDFDGVSTASIKDKAIGHSTWQDWFSTIPAQKSLLMFDSCESGALTDSVVGRELRFRAANDLLGNATGRALLTASSSSGVALEGYKDQGVFAYSVISALSTADRNANGTIDIDELAASIGETVPTIAKEAFGEEQTPQFKAPMNSFDVAKPIR